MTYVLAMKTNNPAELLPLFARLQAGGIHPFVPNFNHGTIAAGYVLALGGFDILLPEYEIEEAKIWMTDIIPIKDEDYDPITDRKSRDILQASVLSMNPLFVLWCLPPLILLALSAAYIGLQWYGGNTSLWTVIFANSSTLCIIGILAHARHIAAQKMRQAP